MSRRLLLRGFTTGTRSSTIHQWIGSRGIHEVFLVSHEPWFRDWTTYNPAGWNSGLGWLLDGAGVAWIGWFIIYPPTLAR
ncbi:hypothetical protein BDW60DRAFT_98787 [Aspergillus nidulans var. acristatus]